MPAATTDNLLMLPRIPLPDPVASTFRSVVRIATANKQLEGEGFQVRRPFPSAELRDADPFLLMDHLGAVEYAPGEAKGAPWHPHRGFETVTIVRKGLIDHSDSLGAAARFGGGDVQWLTAGKGVVHSEMFPLLDPAGPNTVEIFQIWLNLPASAKMSEPHFTMFWSEDIPRQVAKDPHGRAVEVTVIAGRLQETAAAESSVVAPLPPPPDSWAARSDADVAIWTIRLAPGATWTLPAAIGNGTRRSLYFFKGRTVAIAGQNVNGPAAIELLADRTVEIVNGDDPSELLLLQGKPIGEPVVQHGPFVMNTRAEIAQTFADYQDTRFGGWPWPDDAPVHGRDPARFARHPGGREEKPATGD